MPFDPNPASGALPEPQVSCPSFQARWIPQWPRLLGVAAAVLLTHGALWHGMAASFETDGGVAHAAAGPSLQTRALPAPVLAAQAPVDVPAAALIPVVAKNAAPRPARAAPAPGLVEADTATAIPAEAVLPPMAEAAPPVLLAEAGPMAVAMAAAVAEAPVYRTRMPPSTTLNYVMRRGPLSGVGALVWRNTTTGYEAHLEGSVAGFSVMTWNSQGAFDGAGIAPLRFTDKRRGKDLQAANFQRKAGKITYSGPTTEYPLVPGSQDRLSWMIQIAAVASADPKLVAPGGRIAFFVSGARGDADVWAFKVQGNEDVVTESATLHTVKLLREPRKEHDTRVEVWLDPAQHYLPVRARLSNDNSTLELMLSSVQSAS
jgi:hypothetical protein